MAMDTSLFVKAKLIYFTPATLELPIDKRLFLILIFDMKNPMLTTASQKRALGVEIADEQPYFVCQILRLLQYFEHPVLCISAGVILLQTIKRNESTT